MKMVGRNWVLVISLLAMVLLMIIPVQAWTYLASSTYIDHESPDYLFYPMGSSSYPDEYANVDLHMGQQTKFNLNHVLYTDGISHMKFTCEAGYSTNLTAMMDVCTITQSNFCDTHGCYWDRYTCDPTGITGCHQGDTLKLFQDFGSFDVFKQLINGTMPAPLSSFSCSPLLGAINQNIVCTDSSAGAESWYWTIDDETRGIYPAQTSTSQDFTWITAYPGLYSVNLRATNSAGSDWENKTNYVNISTAPSPTPTPTPEPTVAPGYVRSTFITKSSTTWNTIHGSNIMLYDTYSHTWKNSTSDADGILYIDTLPYTTIDYQATFTIFANEYADASGTANADAIGGTFIILMYPISTPPPSGYVNLFVSTMDGANNVLRDVSVVATWGGYQHAGNSGTYGTVQWVVPNETQVHLTGSKAGYDGADEVINTGEGPSYSTILYLDQQGLTPTPTYTSTVTTVGPYGTPGPSGTMPAGYTNNQGQQMMDFLAANGLSLVQLCFFVTVLALLGVKLGK
jgi:PKD repeat protein